MGAIEREHVLGTEALAHRMGVHEALELADKLAVASRLQIRIDSLLEGGEAQLLEMLDLRLCERREREFGERRTAPDGKRFAQQRRALDHFPCPRFLDRLPESLEIEVAGPEIETVARGLRL